MLKHHKNYIIGLFSTLSIFALFVYFFIQPKYGPQITLENSNTPTITPTQEISFNPNYGDISEDSKRIADLAIGELLNAVEGLNPNLIAVKNFEEQEFSDASLGCPKEGESYAQVITPGYRVVLIANELEYDYRIAKDSQSPLLCSK